MPNRFVPISSQAIARRRGVVFGLVFFLTLLAALKWITVIPSDAFFLTKFLMIFFFILTFAWIALFFWSSLFGFWELLRNKNVPGIKWPSSENSPLHSKNVLLMPIYNEDPSLVFANLLAMAQSLEKTGFHRHYDIFVLSDTTNPKLWVEEENLWFHTQKLMPKGMNIYYRRRAVNTARKSGNIEDFCHKWGSLYDFMIVLDADSLLEGKTIVTMSQLMELNGDTGIIQAPPLCINQTSLFSRIQQFAGKVYGPIVSSGLAYWQVSNSNYWGHNAIIRVKAFMDCCKLPILKGKAPLGGPILSHDFVEAALISRGGWKAWLLPELQGSYEECPPSMIDFAVRDRRWCQGNMQHIKVLFSKALHPISRIHFIIGIMSYLSSPLWLCFLLVGLAVALGRNIFPPEYFPATYTLFPNWPIFDKIGVISLFVFSMFMLVFPKILGLIIFFKNYKSSQLGGFFAPLKSSVLEIGFSTLSAPIMMMFQSKFIFDIFSGNSVNWNTQNRDATGTSWTLAWQRHKWHMFLGILATWIVWVYAHDLFWWMLPITFGLMLSIPISVFSSRESWGTMARKNLLFLIPEEVKCPDVLALSLKLRPSLTALNTATNGVISIIENNILLCLHILMLPVNGPAPQIDPQVLETAKIKLDNFLNHHIPPCFDKSEEIALLYHPEILKKSNLVLQLSSLE